MPTTTQRTATQQELEAMRKLLANAANGTKRFKRGAENALVMWAVSLLAILVVWLLLGWALGKAFDLPLGLHSTATAWVLAVAAPLCAGLAVFSSIKWVRTWPDHRPQLQDDIQRATVVDEHYVFTQSKRFQEPEHGGMIYFLRGSENEVFTTYDYDSQTLGVDGAEPLQSSFRPQSQLHVVRTPSSGLALSMQWTGEELPLASPIELAAKPADWPEAERVCPIPWAELEQRLG